jgi:carotenoid 1,2-hydratase
MHASWARRADGGHIGAPGGRSGFRGFGFDQLIPNDGYVWWYIDAVSDDGDHALTIIAFIGSVFSPYYALARRNNRGDPENHCALNVAVYGKSGKRWALTERTRQDLRRDARSLVIGPSEVAWEGSELTVSFDECTVPFPSRLSGTVRPAPFVLTEHVEELDATGRHVWRPIAPRARVSVDLTHPRLQWRGLGYLDSNFGQEPLERCFKRWDWSRAHTEAGTEILYDVVRRDGTERAIALRIDAQGAVTSLSAPPLHALPETKWRVARRARSDARTRPRLIRTLEDTPFYARSLISACIDGQRITAIHESLSLDRLVNPFVRMMLPFRMPRWRYQDKGPRG